MGALLFLTSFFNPTALATVLITFSVYCAFNLYKQSKRLNEWRKQSINGTSPWLLYFRIIQFVLWPDAHLIEQKNIERYGKVYSVNDSDRNFLVIADADLLKDVLVKHFSHFMDKHQIVKMKYLQKWLVLLSRSEWKHTRSIMSPTFTSGKIKAMLYLMNQCLDQMMLKIQKNSGKDVDIRNLFGCFTMDVIARCAFAIETNTHEDDKHPFITNVKKFLTFPALRMFAVFATPEILRNGLGFSIMDPAALHYLKEVGHHMIDERRRLGMKSGNSSYNDFLQLMLEAGEEQEDTQEYKLDNESEKKTLTDEEIIGNIMLIFVAGYETTASLLTFASYALAIYPEIQTKVRQEILETKSNNQELDYETLMSLPYLDCFINETLRMYPPVIRLDRDCSEDITLDYNGNKLLMKKGDSFIVPIYAIHHMEEYYPEPETFKPERFLPENKDQLIPYTFLPFVAGPRNCIGMRFALLEAKLALSHLLLDFDFVRSSRTSIPLDFSAAKMMLTPKEVIVKLQSRL